MRGGLAASAATRRPGSAPPARRWLLLEHPGPWRVDAVAGSGIDPDVLDTLAAGAARSGTRILLVRRPGRGTQPEPRRWQLVSVDGDTVSGPWRADRDLRPGGRRHGSTARADRAA